MSGSFWRFSNSFTSLSSISTILEDYDPESATEPLRVFAILLKLLDDNDLLQELLSSNPMLLEFLREDTVLQFLVDLVITEGKFTIAAPETSNIEPILEEDESEYSSDTFDDSASTTIPKNTKDNLDAKKTDNVSKSVDVSVTNDDGVKTKLEDNKEVDSKAVTIKDDETEEDKAKEVEAKEDELKKDDLEDEDGNSVDDFASEPESEQGEDQETQEEEATRRATIAAEILSADVWSLTDTVMESTANLNKLWSLLNSKTPLSINSSTYFMKIMEHLLDMKCDEMITYLIDHQFDLVEKFMNHLSNPPLMDFLLKLVSTDKPDNSTGIIDFLQQQNLITHLIDALDSKDDDGEKNGSEVESDKDHEKEESKTSYEELIKQSSAADFLKALITISANSTTDSSTIGPNELTRELVSFEQMDRLCNIMLKGGYALANGVGIVIEIIRKNNSDYDVLPVLYITLDSHPPTGRDPIYLGHLLKVFGSKIKHFNEILSNISNSNGEPNTLKTPFGEIEPLGFERFKICELIAELLHCSNMALLNDNKGFEVVASRDELRNKVKEFDPVSFKYNEVVVLDQKKDDDDNAETKDDYELVNDTIDSFNKNDSGVQEHDDEEPHANAHLSEEQIRADPVIGDFLKISLFDNQIISNILSMFFKFPWNNFLHNVVFDIVQQVLNGSMDIGFNKFLAIDLFHLGDITNKIIEGQRLCTEYEETHNGLRLGFMGHLTLIAEEVVKFIQLYPTNTLSELIDAKIEDEIWEDYVSSVLYDTREKYNAILGGDEEEDDEDDEEENNTFEEGLTDMLTGLILDPRVDNDFMENQFQDKDEDEDEDEDEEGSQGRNLSDDSESDDDEHFRNYMSQQLTSTAFSEIVSPSESRTDIMSLQHLEESEHGDGDDDEYIDPNDDGCSYIKSHPLYDSTGSLLTSKTDEDDFSSEDSSSSSSDNDDELADDDKEDVIGNNTLTRAASKS